MPHRYYGIFLRSPFPGRRLQHVSINFYAINFFFSAYDVNDGCLARIFKPDDAPIHAFTMICAGNCTDVNIQIHNIAGALNSFQLVNPAGIELHRSGASNEFEALTFDEIVDSVVDINLMPGSNPGYVKFTDISASNLICLDLMNDMENIPIECFSPPRA